MRIAMLSLLFAAAACGPGQPANPSAPTEPMTKSTTENAADTGAQKAVALYETWLAAVEAKNFERAGELYADDVTFQAGNNPRVIEGRKAVVAMLAGYSAAFPDLESRDLVVMARDRWLAVVALSRGTNKGSLMGMPATGKRTSFRGLQIWTIDERGKIARVVAYADNLNFLGHLGLWAGEVRPVEDAEIPERALVTGPGTHGETADKLVSAVAARDVDAVAALYADSAVLDDASAIGPLEGTDAIRAYWAGLFASFPDLRYADAQTRAVGDRAVITYRFTGTHRGKLARFDAEPSGKPVELVSADLLTVDQQGRIARHDIFMDGMSLGMVLGLIKL